MDVNQFAVYQLKNIPENRQIRFRPYSALQEKGIQIQYEDYEQVYLARMQPEDEPGEIRKRFNEKLPGDIPRAFDQRQRCACAE